MTDTAGPAAPRETREAHVFPCPSCGADLRFDPGAGRLVCDHCATEVALDDGAPGPWGGSSDVGAIREMDFHAALEARLPEADLEITRVLNCTSCGAQVEFDPATHAAECPFCASPVVADTGENRHIKPKGLVPFRLDEATARAAMTAWLGRLWFAPSGLTRYARKGRRMSGIYVPYWTFDAETRSRYRGARGTIHHETRVVMVDGKPRHRTVQKVRWRPAAGQVARAFDDVLVLASRSLPKRFTDALAPWDLSLLAPYRPEYVAGFRAEAYMIELDEAFHEARDYMNRAIARDVRFDIGGDLQRIERIDTDVSAVTFKHVLLPVWVAAYRYRGRSYRFVVNGQTGQVQGERPYSAWKIAVAVALGLIAAATVALVLAQQQGMTALP